MKNKSWLIAALIAASGWGISAPSAHVQKAAVQSMTRAPRIHKAGALGGLLPRHRALRLRYAKGVPTCAARQKRASTKACNVRRHKRHCGARS